MIRRQPFNASHAIEGAANLGVPSGIQPVNYMTSPLFGQATQMLGASLGAGGQTGGLNPLYQIGGPRSAQLALKLMF